ncbi:hypothetical protein LTR36_006109 [Oleoguttula mirabilis]|uniref:RNB domain-containing protein n=1 Tax=Oleoguttula mirabilis TaxID=1507867 RepID=A0AAV9JCQ1_9PEZI|nr:hypothetical protein LTR36_006109 [Oleoguttula mirabilis]
MLPTRNGLARSSSASSHICLSCRIKSQRRLGHTTTTTTTKPASHREVAVGFAGLEYDAVQAAEDGNEPIVPGHYAWGSDATPSRWRKTDASFTRRDGLRRGSGRDYDRLAAGSDGNDNDNGKGDRDRYGDGYGDGDGDGTRPAGTGINIIKVPIGEPEHDVELQHRVRHHARARVLEHHIGRSSKDNFRGMGLRHRLDIEAAAQHNAQRAQSKRVSQEEEPLSGTLEAEVRKVDMGVRFRKFVKPLATEHSLTHPEVDQSVAHLELKKHISPPKVEKHFGEKEVTKHVSSKRVGVKPVVTDPPGWPLGMELKKHASNKGGEVMPVVTDPPGWPLGMTYAEVRKHWGTPLHAKRSELRALRTAEEMDDLLDVHVGEDPSAKDANLDFLGMLDDAVAGRTDSKDPLSLIRKHSRREAEPEPAIKYFDSTGNDFVGMSWHNTQGGSITSRPGGPAVTTRMHTRAFHTSRRDQQQATATAEVSQPPPPDVVGMGTKKFENPNGIRAQLRKWQEMHGDEDILNDTVELDADPDTGDSTNNLTRLPDERTAFMNTQAEAEEEEREAMAHFMQAPSDEPSSAGSNTFFLKMGDLVEIDYLGTGRENIVAVFVRRAGMIAQFYTMQGRWIHMPEKKVQYSITGWVSEDTIKPLLEHLPSPEEVENMEALMEEASVKDLSVPRHVSAPLVSRMVQFHAEAQEIYRRHANVLDNAHQHLAHETDLRYGSLVSAATTLLRTPADKLPLTALFAVRQALNHAGFAFNIDRRSHRLTGYLQIRSKEQVKMVDQVRGWLRDWQQDLATTATMDVQQLRRHRPVRGAQLVYGFVDKAKKIIARSREDRQPTPYGNIGPSKVQFPITPERDSVRITKGEEFTTEDTELVRFIEAWSLSQMFTGLPRVEALPPLLLQATGLYPDYDLRGSTGLQFLQELGTVMPYENRVRFDQHLLLPSSQHSKPLQNLMNSLLDMQDKHNFVDSMADLRHDWGKMPVYCIDAASAHEIDDGLSVEPAVVGSDGVKEWWVHVHIANPTAFFTRDHPLAKMARHMGESIYMPERTYMMLPRWSTQRHFSLAKDRPCLTFSARMDEEGRTLERKVQAGTVRNVLKLTTAEVGGLIGENPDALPETVLTVGGTPPPAKGRRSQVGEVSPAMVQELKVLRRLAEKRADLRKGAGGLFFDTHKPEVDVWQSYKAPGLAWDHPHRRGSRRVEGDPVIQMRTQGLVNWFSPFNDGVVIMVREMMLLACEIAAQWCEERQVPAVFRGSLARPDRMESGRFFDEILAPAAQQSERGEYPMHLGMQYLETFGNTVLSTSPFRHKILGMDAYGKVTSPLRRYGDMILHWQIEAALRQEAETGRSLVTADAKADRRFLPFSTPVLDTIIVGLQPRESIIMRAKMYAENFWMAMLLFRAFHFPDRHQLNAGEALPFGADGKTVHAYCHASPQPQMVTVGCMVVELNITGAMTKPEAEGLIGPAGVPLVGCRQGDTWECELVGIDVFRRIVMVKPRRLVERVEGLMAGVPGGMLATSRRL